MTKKARFPQLRFKGFTEAWEQYKLGQFGYTQSGIGFPEAEQGGKKGIPFFKVSDMNTKGNEHVMTTSNNYVTESQISRKGWKPVSIIPAIMFAKVGAAVMLDRKRYVNEAFLLDNNTMAFSFNEKMEPIFGKVLFDTIYLPGLIQVGALPSFNASDINEVEIRVPKYDEQEKIGELFYQLDNLITLHQRKYDKLVNVKKSLLQTIFPSDSENTPKVRFQGFTEAWEQYKLGELTQITMGQSPLGLNYTQNPKDHILIQGNADMVDGRVRPRVWTKQVTSIAKKDDIIFGVRAPVGSVGKTDYDAVIGRGVASIRGNEFIYQNLIRLKNNDFWKLLSTGSTFDSINSNDLNYTLINIPKIEEQKKIGELFYQLDNLITLHQRKQEKLINVKKSLLNMMFV